MEDGRVEEMSLVLMMGLGREVLERDERRREVAAERVGLVSPVEAVGAASVAVEGVLGLIVVLENMVQMLLLLLMFFFFGFGRRNWRV